MMRVVGLLMVQVEPASCQKRNEFRSTFFRRAKGDFTLPSGESSPWRGEGEAVLIHPRPESKSVGSRCSLPVAKTPTLPPGPEGG